MIIKIFVKCGWCSKVFGKRLSEYKRRTGKSFCSLSCSCSHRNNIYGNKGNIANLRRGSIKDRLKSI